MDAERILDEIAVQQGWNAQSKVDVCLRYIENQQDNGAFQDFLLQEADVENEMTVDEAALLVATHPTAENGQEIDLDKEWADLVDDVENGPIQNP